MPTLYPLIGRIAWALSKRAVRKKLPRLSGKRVAAAGVAAAITAGGAVFALRRAGRVTDN